jgi:hypothetical protein
VAARWSFNCAVVLGRGENGEAKRGVGEMKGAAAPNHFATGGEGGLHGGGEQAMVVLSQGGWLVGSRWKKTARVLDRVGRDAGPKAKTGWKT